MFQDNVNKQRKEKKIENATEICDLWTNQCLKLWQKKTFQLF